MGKILNNLYACFWFFNIRLRSSKADSTLNNFNIWTMSNVKQNSDLIWVHVIGMYILTAITAFFLEGEFAEFARHRHSFLRQVSIYVTLRTDKPSDCRFVYARNIRIYEQ